METGWSTSMPAAADRRLLKAWAETQSTEMRSLSFDHDARLSFAAVEGASVSGDNLLRFANAALLADWACYDADADRADIERLHAVIAAFPRGFRVWFCRGPRGAIPVGYTGWYPISSKAFAAAHDDPASLTHRGELWPVAMSSEPPPFIWLFNYSILSGLRHTYQSRRLLQAYAADLNGMRVSGLAAAVLSEASKSVTARFGMTFRGFMTHQGVAEEVHAVRR